MTKSKNNSLFFCIGMAGLIVTLLPTSCFGIQATKKGVDEKAKSVHIPFNWKKGDVRHYRVTRSEKEQSGRAKSSPYSDVRIEVTDVTEDEVLVTWRMSATVVPNSKPNELADQMNRIYDGLEIKAKIGTDGVYQGVTNWDEIDVANQKSKKLIKGIVDSIPLPKEQKDRVWKTALKQAGTREAVESKMTMALQLLVALTNTEYTTDKIEYYDTEMPYIGQILSAKESYEVKKVDNENNQITIEWKRTVDPETNQAIAEQGIIDMAKEMGKTPPKPGFLDGFLHESKTTYVLELDTGWATSIKSEANVGTKDKNTVKMVLIEQLKKDK